MRWRALHPLGKKSIFIAPTHWLKPSLKASATPPPARALQRLVIAQDTGSAITGAVRADYFWGWGDEAAEQAGLDISEHGERAYNY